ncbi:hypothetical protein LTR09_006288 [Extremus antarcticus]|uniref:Uncharacterized protein n=1 Tax=Extremus antarcticus TaxID=702011 RepID=A0AAJ0DMQ2_9PEZI|nr:hypothetical protein LTR09_006288 [Extremus antarcticus]
MATERLSSILSHVENHASGRSQILRQDPNDVVITLALRTPLCKYKKGGLRDTPLDALVFKTLEQVRLRSNLDPALVGDICLGNVRDGRASYYCRVALLGAGFPNTTCGSHASRFCSSGLTAAQHIANEIITGTIEVGIAVGAESLSEGNERLTRPFDEEIRAASDEAKDCEVNMGVTSENVANDFNISRQMQDKYAVESYRRAEVAQKNGWLDDEIAPITVRLDGKDILLDKDEIRYGTTYEAISQLKPSFDANGKSTPGNSSQITDGAAAVLLMKRSKALELGQPILAKYVGTSLSGLAPRIMGIGPVLAIPKLLEKYNLSLERDVDVVEINEAFASMAVYCRDKLALRWEDMNPRGGAIAVGHPFGMTGVRQIVTGLSELRRRKKKILVTSMCMGTGMGMAGLFVSEQ